MNVHEGPFTRQASGLVKGLSWLYVLIITISAPTGSGILYYSVNMQTAHPGGSVGLAFVIGLALFLPICYLVANMAAGIPRAGSLYVGISRVNSSPMQKSS
jgi:amino acid transporter